MQRHIGALITPEGTALRGFLVRAVDSAGAVAPLFADDSGTPIAAASGVADMARADAHANYSFFVAPGVYHLDIFAPGDLARRVDRIPSFPIGNPLERSLLFEDIPGVAIPSHVGLIHTAGFSAQGRGAGTYVAAVQSDAPSAAGDPTSAVSRNGRDFRLVAESGDSVTQLGALGDGRTDDTAAIQAAIDQHDRLFFPAGTYRITRSLRFRNNQEFAGVSKGGLAGKSRILVDGAIAAFSAAGRGQAPTFHPVFRNLTVNNAAGDFASIRPGSIGIDLEDTSFAVIENCSFRFHQRNVSIGGSLAGYYHTLIGNEYSSATYGIYFGVAGNSNRVVGGRVHGCTTGIYAQACNDNFITLAIERCETGIELDSRTMSFDISCRFEGNGQRIADRAPVAGGRGAAVLLREGARNHRIRGHFSGGSDRVIDLDGRNDFATPVAGHAGTHLNSTNNMFWNESLDVDSNGDGLADGLFLSDPGSPAIAHSLTANPNEVLTGARAQKIVASAGRPRQVRVDPFPTTPGQLYVFAARVRLDSAAAWNLRGSALGFAASELANIPLNVADDWVVLAVPFRAERTAAHFYFQLHAAPAGRGRNPALLIDAIWFGTGGIAPMFGSGTARQSFPTFTDNRSASAAGMAAGALYKTPTGELRVVV